MKDKTLLEKIAFILAAVVGVVSLYAVFVPILPTYLTRSLHLSTMITLLFLVKPFKKLDKGVKKQRLHIIDVAAIIIAWVSFAYNTINYDHIIRRYAYVTPMTTAEIIIAALTILVIIEGCRRTTGWILPILACVFGAYAMAGPYMPQLLRHKGYSIINILDNAYLTTGGIFGDPINTSASYIIMFMIFGVFLERSGVGEAFIEFADRAVGWSRGGSAKASVVSSALFGTISGSALANVTVTGSFTIPLMKRTGFEPHEAGGVEAAASSGGQLMPPIMGSAVFIMVEFIGMSYGEIVLHAIVPAFMYFFGIFITIDLLAEMRHIGGQDHFDGKLFINFLLRKGYLFLSIVSLIVCMALGYTAIWACGISMLVCILLSWITPKNGMRIKEIITCISKGVQSTASIAMTCGCAGIAIGMINLSGIAVKFSMLITSISDHLFLVLIIVALAGLIMGLGLPTTPCYIIQAGLLAPCLVGLGLLPIQAHLFVFWFSVIAMITPPVCLVAYTAAGIAEASMTKTGWFAFSLALGGFVAPFIFAMDPGILLIGTPAHVIWSVFATLIGVVSLSTCTVGFLKRKCSIVMRAILGIGGCLMLWPGVLTDIIGISSFAACLIINLILNKKDKRLIEKA